MEHSTVKIDSIRLNILIATDSFYPDGVGGKHTYVYNLAKEFLNKGHSVYVLTVKLNSKDSDEENIEGIKVYRYNSILSGRMVFLRRPVITVYNVRKLFKKLARTISIDIINFHSLFEAAGIQLAKESFALPKVFTFHASVYQEIIVQSKKKHYGLFLNSLIFSVVRFLEKIILKNSYRIIVLSEFNKEQLNKLFKIYGEKIELIPGGVDMRQFKPAEDIAAVRQQLNLPKDKILFLTIRRLVTRMGIDVLIDAFRIIHEKQKNVMLLIGGDGFLRNELQKNIERLGLAESIKMLGFIKNEQLTAYYQAADLFVLPTQELEGFGLVTLEALSCGLPVMGTAVGGTIEILQKFDANMLFEGKNAQDMAKGIGSFLEGKFQPGCIRGRCREFVMKNYSWEKVCDITEKLFGEVRSKNNG